MTDALKLELVNNYEVKNKSDARIRKEVYKSGIPFN